MISVITKWDDIEQVFWTFEISWKKWGWDYLGHMWSKIILAL